MAWEATTKTESKAARFFKDGEYIMKDKIMML